MHACYKRKINFVLPVNLCVVKFDFWSNAVSHNVFLVTFTAHGLSFIYNPAAQMANNGHTKTSVTSWTTIMHCSYPTDHRMLLACPSLHLVFAYPFHFGKSGFPAYFFTPNPDIQILSGFFVQVHIGPLLFSNCKWHRRRRPTDLNKNCSNVNTIMWWCNVFQTSDWLKPGEWWRLIEELRVRGVTQEVRLRGLNRRTRDSSHYRNEYTEALHSSDLPELPFIPWTHGCWFCCNLKYRDNTTRTVYASSRNSRILTLRYPDFWLP